MNKHKEIFERMHEKMTPGSEAEKRLFERAEAEACGKVIPSEENSGGITMNKTTNEMTHKTDMDTVHTRRGGFIAAAAAVAMVLGIGGYTLFTGTPDIDEKASPTTTISKEDTASDVSAAKTTVTADIPDAASEKPGYEGEVVKVDEEQAVRKAAVLLDVSAADMKVVHKTFITNDGIRSYELEIELPGKEDHEIVDVSVEYPVLPDDSSDLCFSEETAAGQALADAGVASDGYEAISTCVIADTGEQEPIDFEILSKGFGFPDEWKNSFRWERDDGSEIEAFWYIRFTAKGKRYYYLIDDMANIVEKHSEDAVITDR